MPHETDNHVEFKDRKGMLIAFGILQILLGTFCAFLLGTMLLAMVASQALQGASATTMTARTMVPALLMYSALAVWFIWMGIGSLKARRWARALLLVTSWLWLISGIIGLAFALWALPEMYGHFDEGGQVPKGVVAFIQYITLGFMAFFYVLVPASFVLFYGSKHVKATCEHRDPQVRWTDACPLPVLGVSVMAATAAAWLPTMGLYGWALPWFGRVINGTAGATVAMLFALLLAYVAWGAYRLRPAAWWCATLLIIVWGGSTLMTFYRVGLAAFYEHMDFPAEQLEQVKSLAEMQSSTTMLLAGGWFMGALVYLAYVRRYFHAGTPAHNGAHRA